MFLPSLSLGANDVLNENERVNVTIKNGTFRSFVEQMKDQGDFDYELCTMYGEMKEHQKNAPVVEQKAFAKSK